jgi:hypothetical protein
MVYHQPPRTPATGTLHPSASQEPPARPLRPQAPREPPAGPLWPSVVGPCHSKPQERHLSVLGG